MGFRKCPICELNYISEDQKCCDVCRRAQHGVSDPDDMELMCIECGENPAVRGSELCAACLREARRQEKQQKPIEPLGGTELDVGALDDMEVPLDSDIPESEMEEIHKGLDEDFPEDEDDEEEEKDDEDMA